MGSTDMSGHPLFDQLEAGAAHGIDPHHAMLASIAISLKRIADAHDETVEAILHAADALLALGGPHV